jgi:endonuclease/exonuclease/phosphatase family metal-dependent hydrolase
MDKPSPSDRDNWQYALFLGLLFLLFFQLVSDFIETVYAFGLLGTNIPPEIISVLLFFTPLILLLFRHGLPYRVTLALAAIAALAHPLEGMLDPKGKMLVSGLGVGCLFILLPALLANQMRGDARKARLPIGSGLALGLAFSILLRSLAAGTDLSLINPWLSWLLAIAQLALIVWLARAPVVISTKAQTGSKKRSAPFGVTAALCVGLIAVLATLYFAFASPTVLARWSGLDYRLLLLVLSLALAIYALLSFNNRLSWLTRSLVIIWNGLFLLAGTLAILSNQVSFPQTSSAYPFDQPVLAWWQQIPFILMLLLSPVVLPDFSLLTRELVDRKPSPRYLAGGFSLAALFFLLVVFTQVFTTVYDYIPVVGLWFRNRFWLVFLIAGLGMALPVLTVRTKERQLNLPAYGKLAASLVVAALLVSTAWVIVTHPVPPQPQPPDSLRVLTYNIQQGYSPAGRRSYADQLAVIRSLDPDLIGLQETDVARFAGGNADVVRTFSAALNMYVYYGPKTVTGTFGITLLSRYPLQNPHTFFMYSAAEQTAAIQAEITVKGKTYQILVTHLGNGGPLIQQQQVLVRLAGLQNVIAMGDYNFDQKTDQYKLTTQSLEDAWVSAGSPAATGLDMSHLIDHIFISPGMTVQSVQYVPAPASDHPALLAVFTP